MKYVVTTSPFANGRIEQLLETDIDGVRETVWRMVMDTSEKQVRDALIALGWTPPTGDKSAG